MSDPEPLELPATAGGHPDVQVDAPELLTAEEFAAAVDGVDHVDVKLIELNPGGVDRFGDDSPAGA